MLTLKQQSILQKYFDKQRQDKAALTIYPFRYEKRILWNQEDFGPNTIFVMRGKISSVTKTLRFKNRAITRFNFTVGYQEIGCVMYNRPYFKNSYQDQEVTLTGQFNEKRELVVMSLNQKTLSESIGLFPIYPLKQGVTQHQLRSIMKKVLNENKVNIQEMIPNQLREIHSLYHTFTALSEIHFPSCDERLFQALKTLKYAEALRYQTALTLQKQQDQAKLKLVRRIDEQFIDKLIHSLNYKLTDDQKVALQEVVNDIKTPQVMRRLLLGDVGSGKTIVALITSLAMLKAGYSVAFLCPTEVLAQQHFETFKSMTDNVTLLTSTINTSTRHFKSNEIVIGTHALFSETTQYENLGLLIIDEQHRFGVNQRQKMLDKGEFVDVLMLSATPIPRTLASTLFAHLSISTIQQYPSFRKGVVTKFIHENSIQSIQDELLQFIASGQQAYIICPAIEEESDTRNVISITKNLKKALPNIRIGSIHGGLKSNTIQNTLDDFRNHQLDLLVSTTIIEVGIHVDNANMMIIYDADRFGLSQLHQLRGRIGRGQNIGYCYVLSSTTNQDSLNRLNYFEQESNGFKLAQQDLLMRGTGDLLGLRQSGYPQFALLNLQHDLELLELARQDAQILVAQPTKEGKMFIDKIEKQLSSILNQAVI